MTKDPPGMPDLIVSAGVGSPGTLPHQPGPDILHVQLHPRLAGVHLQQQLTSVFPIDTFINENKY